MTLLVWWEAEGRHDILESCLEVLLHEQSCRFTV